MMSGLGGMFSASFSEIVDFKCKFLCVDKMLGVDITVKILRKFTLLGKW